MNIILAIAACIGVWFIYIFIGMEMGWRHGGGTIPFLILVAAMIGTWRFVRKFRKVKPENQQGGDSANTL